ncbi:MAG: Gfo/Idh/MocA family oxidoreductase [Parcubacteria group bacterium]
MEKYKIAIIGLGNRACEDHFPSIIDSDRCVLVSVCDKNKEIALKFSEKYNVPYYTSCKNLLDAHDLDFAILSTSHDAHLELVQLLSSRGIHILKEKPFARNFKEAMEMKKAVESQHVEMMITLQRRFNPIYKSFESLIKHIGKPFFIEGKYSLFVNNPGEGWRGNRLKSGGGCILDMGYHLIDLIIWYFGLPSAVHADFSAVADPDSSYDAEDTASVLFRYSNELFGSVIFSRYYPPKTEYLKVLGTKGVIELQRGSIRRLRSDGSVADSLTREIAWPAAAIEQVEYFCEVIDGEAVNIGSPNVHLNHMAFTQSCYDSYERKEYVNPNLYLEGMNG